MPIRDMRLGSGANVLHAFGPSNDRVIAVRAQHRSPTSRLDPYSASEVRFVSLRLCAEVCAILSKTAKGVLETDYLGNHNLALAACLGWK